MKKEKKLGILAAVFALALGGATVSHAALVLDAVEGDSTTIKVSTETEAGKTTAKVSAITGAVSSSNGGLVTGATVHAYLHSEQMALGYGTKADGEFATAYGFSNNAEGEGSTAVGFGNDATTQSATAVGYWNSASGEEYATAIGSYNEASGKESTAIGFYNEASGEEYATAMGSWNKASGNWSTALGLVNEASGEEASAVGAFNTAGADGSTAMGINNAVYGKASAAFGYNNTVGATTEDNDETIIDTEKGNNTYVFGANNEVTANNAIVVGNGVTGTVGDGAIVLGTDITGDVAKNSVVIGNGSTSEEENTVSVGTKGNERKIVHVKDGTEKTDAATYGQIAKNDTYEVKDGKVVVETNAGGTAFTITGLGTSSADIGDTKKLVDAGLGDNVVDSVLNVNDKIGNLSDDINKVGAGAAALAALHPEGFDPADKWSFAVGYGHYKSANAGALGAFYKPNFDTTLSVGGTIGNGNSMLNAGVSFKLGQRGARLSQNASNPQLVQEVNALRAENASQAKEIAALRADNEQMKRQIATILSKMEISD